MDSFSGYHPLVNFLYFLLVTVCAMFFMHPACLAISLVCAVSYSLKLRGARALLKSLVWLAPLLLVSAAINPLFNHEGATILAYFTDGNPLTLESIIYGVASATMIVTVITWFSCYSSVMTSDKFIYLFGRIIPAISLVLSMALRFVPRFTAQIKVISNAQKCIGRDASNGSLVQRVKHGVQIVSIMVTWALENAIDTADSMKSRGYGLKGRTAFSIFRFEKRDKLALLALCVLGAYVLAGSAIGAIFFRYFPSIKCADMDFFSGSVLAAYFLMCVMPLLLQKDYAYNC